MCRRLSFSDKLSNNQPALPDSPKVVIGVRFGHQSIDKTRPKYIGCPRHDHRRYSQMLKEMLEQQRADRERAQKLEERDKNFKQ